MITITSVKVYPFDTTGTGGSIRAYAELEVDGSLTFKGIRVMQSESGGYFISYPSQRTRRDTFIDLVIPDKEAARMIREAVMSEFRKVFGLDEEGKN